MPLVDLKTDLKSLRYGKDRPGGGSSNQPFIQVDPKDSFDIPLEEIGTSGGKDFILRGGALTANRSVDDVLRLTKWGLQGSKGVAEGLLFTAKQESLALQGQRIGAGGPDKNGISGEGIYLPTSTLAQVAVNAFGGHGNKQGANPFPFDKSITVFGRQINFNNGNSGGRPTYLSDYIYDSLIPAEETEYNRLVHLSETTPYNDSGTLFSYKGGPGATGGIVGDTQIRFSAGNRVGLGNPLLAGSYSNTTKFLTPAVNSVGLNTAHYDYSVFKNPNPVILQGSKIFNGTLNNSNTVSGVYSRLVSTTNPLVSQAILAGYKRNNGQGALREFANDVYTQGNTFPQVDNQIVGNNNTATLTQEQLINRVPLSKGGQLQDFRKEVTVNKSIAKINGMLIDAPNYQEKNIDKRLNYFDPGSKARNRSSYTKGSGIVDAINGLYLYYQNNVNTSGTTNDLVKFRFAVVDPDNPASKTFVHFRSYFDGSITDNMGASWDSYRYQGRGEEFFHYKGFTREMGFGFKVVAQSKEELSVMYQKLNYLQSVMAPNYSNAGYMRGNIVQVTIGGYIYEMPGVLTGLNYTIDDTSPWEIGINDKGGYDKTVKELPHIVSVSVNFKPIHTFLPETIKPAYINAGNNITQRFLSLANAEPKNSNNLYAQGTRSGVNLESKLALSSLPSDIIDDQNAIDDPNFIPLQTEDEVLEDFLNNFNSAFESLEG